MCQSARFLKHLFVRHDPAYEAERTSFIGTESAPAEQELKGAVTPHDVRQVRKMDRRNEAKIDLGVAETRVLAGDENVAGNGECHAAPACCAGDGGNRRFVEMILRVA